MSENLLTSETISKMREICRQGSLERMISQSQHNDFVIQDLTTIPNYSKVFKNWMSIILISGSASRITYKIHYDIKDTKKILTTIYNKPASDIGPLKCTDFMKEYCNLSAGYIKAKFDEAKISLGISLPLNTRGLYEAFYERSKSTNYVIDYFSLKLRDVTFVIEVFVDIYQLEALDHLKNINLNEVKNNDNDLEFF